MLPEHCETRERERGRRRKGRKGREENASRVGAFENVISIIARWFYEAVQARNVWRLDASLYALSFSSFRLAPIRFTSTSVSLYISLSLSLAVYIFTFRPYGSFSRGKCLSLSVHFNLLKARKATLVPRRDMWASNVTSWMHIFQIPRKTNVAGGRTITNVIITFPDNIRASTIYTKHYFKCMKTFFFSFFTPLQYETFKCQIW